MSEIDKDQLINMMREAGKDSGLNESVVNDPKQTAAMEKILSQLNPSQASKLQTLLSDKEATRQMLSTPQAQALLKRLLG